MPAQGQKTPALGPHNESVRTTTSPEVRTLSEPQHSEMTGQKSNPLSTRGENESNLSQFPL